uniref:Helicase-associated domain-containing protein n=1 Tax=Entomoneis paludosa TaxID=265537 RepID=A0A7S3DQC6_9STRA
MAKTLPWKTKLAVLRKFKDQEGHTLVPQSFIDPETGFRLGRWVANLRQRSHFLNETQLQDLECLDFVWSRFKVLPWDMKIDLLQKFKLEHGHALVPKDYVDGETGFHLGWWVDRMRQGKRSMNKARLQDLEDAGFVWNAFDATWENMYVLLQQYHKEFHHVCPKINEHYRGKPLGHWVGMQRQLYARKMKSPEQATNKTTVISHKRISLLESIGFVWRLRTSGSADYEYQPHHHLQEPSSQEHSPQQVQQDQHSSHHEEHVQSHHAVVDIHQPLPYRPEPSYEYPLRHSQDGQHVTFHHGHYQPQQQYPVASLSSSRQAASPSMRHDMPLSFARMETYARSA